MKKQQARGGSSTRQTILVIFLLIAGAGCIYEFSFARPQFQAAWEKIKTVDGSADSGEYTSDKIREMMGRDPISEDHEQHDDCVVQTFRWKSGLLVKNHDIHVVYTKNKSVLSERSDLIGKLYYFSASAGQPLDSDKNFPLEQETININLNPPAISMGGAPPRKGKSDPEDEKKKEKKDEKKEGDKEPQDKDDEKAGEKKADEKMDDVKKDDEKEPQDKDDEKAGEKKANEKMDDVKKDDKDGESGDSEKSGEAEKSAEDKSAEDKSDDGEETEKPESDEDKDEDKDKKEDKKESGPDKS